MKVLVISPNHTHPVTNGTAKFIGDYCDLIRQLGHDVYFLHITYCKKDKSERDKNRSEVDGSRKAWGDHYFHYETKLHHAIRDKLIQYYRKILCNSYGKCDDHYPIGLDNYVKKINKVYRFDAVIINYYWLSKLYKNCDISRQAIVTHDSYSYYNFRNNLKMWFNVTPNEEAKAMQRCKYIFAMQNEEAAVFRYLSPKSKVLVSYCNYDLNIQQPTFNHNLLLFSGGFKMNRYGLEWFMKDVFPYIKKEFPDVRLVIGGSICKTIPEYRDNPDVDMIGFVDDPADFFKLGDVAINPTYLGAGLKIKTFEALSYGKVVMVHPHCTVGIFRKENAPIFNSGNAEEWVAYLHEIWDNQDKLSEMQNAVSEYMSQMNKYIKSQFEEFLS